LKKKNPPYKTFNHTADMGFDVNGKTRKDLFRHAAQALFTAITEVEAIEIKEERFIAIAGMDMEDLWINFLRELLYLFNGAGFLVRTVDILKIGNNNLSMRAKGETFDSAKHEIINEIKAITYHQARVRKTSHGWTGRFIADV
jgi:SHS2 domain-containing protein